MKKSMESYNHSDDLETRLWKRVDRREDEECWPFVYSTNTKGYGQFSYKNKRMMAHRVAFELAYGPIPKEMVIDHLCRNTSCCNPNHLEAVTGKENILRGFGSPAMNARKKSCKNGHKFDVENTAITPEGARYCRTCKREYNLMQYYRKKTLEQDVLIDKQRSALKMIKEKGIKGLYGSCAVIADKALQDEN